MKLTIDSAGRFVVPPVHRAHPLPGPVSVLTEVPTGPVAPGSDPTEARAEDIRLTT